MKKDVVLKEELDIEAEFFFFRYARHEHCLTGESPE